MQERKNEHYSNQTGHALRGIADRFRREVGYPPRVFSAEIVFLPQVAQDRRRAMRRISKDGR